jgi:hypothetical protein
MSHSPSIVPDEDIYLVLDDFGPSLGRAWRETDEAGAGRATLVRNLLEGQYEDPFASLPSIQLKAGRVM